MPPLFEAVCALLFNVLSFPHPKCHVCVLWETERENDLEYPPEFQLVLTSVMIGIITLGPEVRP